MRYVVACVGIAGLAMIGVFAVSSWRERVVSNRERAQLEEVSRLLSSGDSQAALAMASEMKNASELSRESKAVLANLEVDAILEQNQYTRLAGIYRTSPETFDTKEEAALLVARMLLQEGDDERLSEIRESWRGREQTIHAWAALDADILIRAGEWEQAKALLDSQVFEGTNDSVRLTRLALMVAPTDINQAWDYLGQAFQKDPRDPDVRSFRGQILETIGQHEVARVEYVAAHVTAPDNPVLRNQLAEFYRRQRSYGLAVQTWTEGFSSSSIGTLWSKGLFWNRVTVGRELPVGLPPPPEDDLCELVLFLQDLPASVFWDEDGFQQLVDVRRFEAQRQEVHWLRLLQKLKDKDYDSALESVSSHLRSGKSWHAELELRLAQVLQFRHSRKFNTVFQEPTRSLVSNRHPFFVALSTLNGPEDPEATVDLEELEQIATHPNAVSACFLAAGWVEAALLLCDFENPGFTELPSWWTYGIIQCTRSNRSNEAALDLLSKLEEKPASVQLLQGEILASQRQYDQAIKCFQPLQRLPNAIGSRASWLLTELNLARGDVDSAESTIDESRHFASSIVGRELLAKVKLVRGETDEAELIYRELEDASVQGLAYRARQAFSRKDYAEAKQLTVRLLEIMPDSMQLLANLQAINEAEANKDVADAS